MSDNSTKEELRLLCGRAATVINKLSIMIDELCNDDKETLHTLYKPLIDELYKASMERGH